MKSPKSAAANANTEQELRKKYEGLVYTPEEIMRKTDEANPEYFARLSRLKIEQVRQLAQGKRVLDLCCATGMHLIELADVIREGAGLDFSRPFLIEAKREAERRGIGTVRFALGNARKLPFADGSFDIVFSFASLYDLPGADEVLAEVGRILAPGGKAIFDLGNLRSLNTLVSRAYPEIASPFHMRIGEMKRIIRAAGLEIERHRAFQLLPLWGDRPRWLRPMLKPFWKKLMERNIGSRMLDEHLCRLPIFKHLAFRHLFVCSKRTADLGASNAHYLADQRAHFDELITDQWGTYQSEEWDDLRRFEVARLFSRIKPRTILDIGCGCGFHDSEMARYPFVEKVDGIDYSAQSIARADKAYPHPKVHRKVADVMEMDDSTPSHLVVSFQVVEHVEDAKVFMRRCAELCRPGGHVAVFTVNRLRPYNRRRIRAGKAMELDDPMHKKEFTMADLAELGHSAELKMVGGFGYCDEAKWPIRKMGLWVSYLWPLRATRLCAIFRKA